MKPRIIAAVGDLFFAAKIRGTAEQVGAQASFPKTGDALLASAREETPALFVFDLQAQNFDPFEVARTLKADKTLAGVPLVGFFSHVETELHRRAVEAGFDACMPRSQFAGRLPEILRGYFG